MAKVEIYTVLPEARGQRPIGKFMNLYQAVLLKDIRTDVTYYSLYLAFDGEMLGFEIYNKLPEKYAYNDHLSYMLALYRSINLNEGHSSESVFQNIKSLKKIIYIK